MSNNAINGISDYKVGKIFEGFNINLLSNKENLTISISENKSFYIYEFNYNLEYLCQINTFKSKNNIKEIEELIVNLIEEKKIKITIDNE